jgi:hypothetical protein
MRSILAILVAAALGAGACGPTEPGGGGGARSDGGGAGGDGGGGGVDAAPGGGDPGASIPACWRSCDTVADCDLGTAVTDADNFTCDDGLCVYQGCNSTAECVAAFGTTDYACGTVPGIGVATCLKSCGQVSDCALASAAFDEDNYRCTGGLCEYTGCNGDSECISSFGAAYGCRTDDLLVPSCSARCAGPADCALAGGGALHDEDNYECGADGFCRWTGCRSTAECTSTFMNDAYVCR